MIIELGNVSTETKGLVPQFQAIDNLAPQGGKVRNCTLASKLD
jgi:hypothetical protein